MPLTVRSPTGDHPDVLDHPAVLPIVMLVGIVLSCVAALFGGRAWGRRVARRGAWGSDETRSHIGVLQAASLGLLALLLGFSFAGSSNRFLERQRLVVEEANAIGTAWLRAGLLDEAWAVPLRESLEMHAADRAALGQTTDTAEIEAIEDRMERRQSEFWEIARDGAAAEPSIAVVVLEPVNAVIDLHQTRKSAARLHLPVPVLLLLLLSAMLAIGSVGFGEGLTGCTGSAISIALVLLIALALWVIGDLDHPRRGLIRVDQSPVDQVSGDIARPSR